jgi:hypothetical protein
MEDIHDFMGKPGLGDISIVMCQVFSDLCDGLDLNEIVVDLIEIFRLSNNPEMRGPLLRAIFRVIDRSPDSAYDFLKSVPITPQFRIWADDRDRRRVELLLIVVQCLFRARPKSKDLGPAQDCFEVALRIMETWTEAEVQKKAVCALLNVVETERSLAEELRTKERRRWLREKFEGATFHVRRALLRVFVALDCRGAGRPALVIAAMDFAVEILAGYRGTGMLLAIVGGIKALCGRGGEAADVFVHGGGVQALVMLVEDDSADARVREAAERLLVECFDAGWDRPGSPGNGD